MAERADETTVLAMHGSAVIPCLSWVMRVLKLDATMVMKVMYSADVILGFRMNMMGLGVHMMDRGKPEGATGVKYPVNMVIPLDPILSHSLGVMANQLAVNPAGLTRNDTVRTKGEGPWGLPNP